jgi:serine/threonine protein kinase
MTVQVGTPAYMCPEMAHGAADMNEAVDVYSFGCVWLGLAWFGLGWFVVWFVFCSCVLGAMEEGGTSHMRARESLTAEPPPNTTTTTSNEITPPTTPTHPHSVLLWALWTCQQPYFYLGPVTPVQLLSRVVAGLRPRVDQGMPRELVDLMRCVRLCLGSWMFGFVLLGACLALGLFGRKKVNATGKRVYRGGM